ncbi:MAG: biotin--[Lachnospiraceae bacterium]|nr:biotin--[acetyl-CoA-carboxylase] ligase [Lachnospiraceae bacterium]
MKAKILRALKETKEEFISGARLCEQFGVSRQAVWKNISALKEAGYEIESVSNKGYRLVSSPKRLYGPEIECRLSEGNICKKVLGFDEIDSTNTKAKQLAEFGEEEGTLIIAERQTAGKGRRGRSWSSEKGDGIYMSLLLRPKAIPPKASGLTILASLAVAGAIKKISSLPVEIKWPNDIVAGGKKICGILTEMSSEESYIHYVVIGIGINVNTETFPEELEYRASSIYLETGEKTDRLSLVAEILNSFDTYYKRFMKEQSLVPFLEEYNAVLVNREKEVKIYYGMVETAKPEEIESGIAKGVDGDGSLVVLVDGKEKHIVSGEVSVRGVMDYTD